MSDEINETTALVPLDSEAVQILQPEQLPDLDAMDEGMSLAPSYREFQEGQSVRAVLCGFSEMESQKKDGQDKGRMIPMAVFQSKDGVWVNAGANLVQQVKNVPIGTALQVTFKGKERTKGGFSVNTFEVRLLNPAGSGSSAASPATSLGSAAPSQSAPAQTTQAAPAAKADITVINMIGAVARAKKVGDLDGLSKQMLGKPVAELDPDGATALLDYLKTL